MKGTKIALALLLSAVAASTFTFPGEDFLGLPMESNEVSESAATSGWSSWIPTKESVKHAAHTCGSVLKQIKTSGQEKIAPYMPSVDYKTAGIYGGAIGSGLVVGYAIQKGIIGKTGRFAKAGYQKTVNGLKSVNARFPKAKWAGLATSAATVAGLGVLAYSKPELLNQAIDVAQGFGLHAADWATKAGYAVRDNKNPILAGVASAIWSTPIFRHAVSKEKQTKA